MQPDSSVCIYYLAGGSGEALGVDECKLNMG